jgi:hypothetical protein
MVDHLQPLTDWEPVDINQFFPQHSRRRNVNKQKQQK